MLPTVERIAGAHPERTIFTRLIPIEHPGEMVGTWRGYYERWANMALEALPRDAVKSVPSLARLVPPADALDKTVYSPWVGTDLHERLRARKADALIITGTETDVCVLGAVLGAVDLG